VRKGEEDGLEEGEGKERGWVGGDGGRGPGAAQHEVKRDEREMRWETQKKRLRQENGNEA
jgi:hypothetical protein